MRAQRRRPAESGSTAPRLGVWALLALTLLGSVYLGGIEYSRPHVTGQPIRFSDFVQLVKNGRVREARVLEQDRAITGSYQSDGGGQVRYSTFFLDATQGQVLNELILSNVVTTVDQQVAKRVVNLLTGTLLPQMMVATVFLYIIVSYRLGTGLFGVRSGARTASVEESQVTFDDVAGQDAAVAELREIGAYLADPSRFASVGATIPKGILLFGPPGCGKTLLARALAGEAGATVLSISGSDFIELYAGVGASRVRDLFEQARQVTPAIVFIDEIDSIGRARTGSDLPNADGGEQAQALNQILVEMDGFSPSVGIIVLAATNRPDVLDPALLRPGRFDRAIGLERPNERGRRAVLAVHARAKTLTTDVDLDAIARRAIGLTGADLASVLNEAALSAVRDGRVAVSQPDLLAALERILDTPERQRRLAMRPRRIGRRAGGEHRVTFRDLAGIDDAVTELAEVRDYLADPERFLRMGARLPRGILLTGPPGCGKTLLARAVAGEANAAFLSVSGSEFSNPYAGEGAGRVRDLFADARSMEPAIVFIDEIDSLGTRRRAATDEVLNQVLVELDGFESRGGVIVVAATNRPDILDPALLRPGRFDRRITIHLPDRAGRLAILQLRSADIALAAEVDLDGLAAQTQGLSGADLVNVLNEAALLAARQGRSEIHPAHLDEGLQRATRGGVASRRTVLSSEERAVIACHEAGHALVALALPGGEPPHRVSVAARGSTLGHCTTAPAYGRLLSSRPQLIDQMAVLIAGWSAERLVFGHSGTAAGSDLRAAGDIARRMVRDWAMSDEIGLLPSADTDHAGQTVGAYSERMSNELEREAQRLLDQSHQRAKDALRDNRAILDRISDALLRHETLSGEEVRALAKGVGAGDALVLSAAT